MKIRDKNLKEVVDVSCEKCPTYSCYWPRPDPGIFTQGQGYRTRHPELKNQPYICGHRAIHGCPENTE